MLSNLTFGSFLVYVPKRRIAQVPDDLRDDAVTANNIMFAVKQEKMTGKGPTSKWLAGELKSHLSKQSSPLKELLGPSKVLIPMPGSSPLAANALWVPKLIADALCAEGLGASTLPCVQREMAVAKSAFAGPGGRADPDKHYDSMAIVPQLGWPKEVVLIDDVVTRGSTFLGAASLLHDAHPDMTITSFAMILTVRDAADFKRVDNPCVGSITMDRLGNLHRNP